MSRHGAHGQEEAAASAVVHPGVQGRDLELCRRGDRSVGQVAKDFDLTGTAVRQWVVQASVTPAPGATG